MINIKESLLLQLIQAQEIPTEEQIAMFKTLFANYLYPIGTLPNEAFNNKKFLEDSLEHALQYLDTLFDLLFSDYYTKEELRIFATYFSFNVLTKITLSQTYLDRIVPIISKTSNKQDVQYVIEELKNRYLTHLLFNEPNNPQINTLIEELSAIEETHNKFNLEQRYK